MPPQTSSHPPSAASGTSSHEPTPRHYPYKKRPYAQACLACRARKIRCADAETPPCKACRIAQIPCEFPTSSARQRRQPPASSSRDGSTTTTSRPGLPAARNSLTSAAPSSASVRDAALKREHEHETYDREARYERHRVKATEHRLRRIEAVLHLPPLSDVSDSEDSGTEERIGGTSADGGEPAPEEIEPPRLWLRSGAAEPVYHGETSMHDDGRQLALTNNVPNHSPMSTGSVRGKDAASWTYEDIRAMTRMRHKYATPDEGEALVDAYFCWASNTAHVNRDLFLRDMAVGGPYFSDLLLLVMYHSGVRFSPHLNEEDRGQRRAQYMAIIMSIIAEELCKPSSIATAQAFLLLAGTRCAIGDMTQAWLFTGLAIRMIQDLGIHLAIDDPGLDEHFDHEVREVRVRLYWSAYCWDKQLSLGMGREPALLVRPGSIPKVDLLGQHEDWNWAPIFHGGGYNDMARRYPKTSSHVTSVIIHNAELNMILEDILVNMYSPHRPQARSAQFVRQADERLLRWREDLPSVIRLERGNFPDFCPPTNVTVLNLLYHTTRILLYRPLLTVRNRQLVASSLEVCRTAAIDIHAIVSLWVRTFGNVNMVYLQTYATFIAAGVDVTLIRLGDAQTREEALRRVHLGVAILEQASAQVQGVRRGVAIIRSQLEALFQRERAAVNNGGPAPAAKQITNKPLNTFVAPQPLQTMTSADRTTSNAQFDTTPSAGSNPSPAASDLIKPAIMPAPNAPLNLLQHQQQLQAAAAAAAPPQLIGPTFPVNADPTVNPAAANFAADPTAMGQVDFPILFDEAALANLLGESNVGTDDPFAFLSAEGWDDVIM